MHLSLPAFAAFALLLVSTTLASARVDIAVDLSRQAMQVNSAEGSFVWPISSGRFGFHTPQGSYRIGRLEPMHRSRRYNNAAMPNAMFFHGGYAIHGTDQEGALGSPASHGCIRLSRTDAASLYDMVRREGGRVTIVGTSPQDASRPRLRRRPRRADPYGDENGYDGFGAEAFPSRGWRYQPQGLDDDFNEF